MSFPSNVTVPALAATEPMMVHNSVDFPAPLGPRRLVMVPSRTSRLGPQRTCMRP
ncbi:MAG: hypothetical protein HW408_879 [Actinobacteria bacterium]|nr:hypothetical protein [Actinomycetota bacterium]